MESIEKLFLYLLPEGLRRIVRNHIDAKDSDELISNSTVAFLYKILGMLCGYVFIFLITRKYGAYVMGVFAISMTALNIFSVVGRLGLETALLRFIAEYSSHGKSGDVKSVYLKALSVALPLSLLLSIVLFVSSGYLAKELFNDRMLTAYFRAVAFAIPALVLFSLHIEAIRGLRRIRDYALMQNLPIPLFACIILLVSMATSSDPHLPLIAYVASLLVASLLSFMKWLKESGLPRVSVESPGINLKSILSVSLPMMLSSSLFLIMGHTDIIILGLLTPVEEVGIYNVALKIAALASITLYSVNSIAAPKFAELYSRGDMKGLAEFTRRSTKLIFWSSFPILAAAIIFPSSILGFFGEGFSAGALALLMLTIGQFVNAISGSVGYIMQMTGRQNTFQKIVFMAVVINIGLNIILIPHFGLNGAAFASMASIIFWNLCSALYIRAKLNFTTFYVPGFKYPGLS